MDHLGIYQFHGTLVWHWHINFCGKNIPGFLSSFWSCLSKNQCAAAAALLLQLCFSYQLSLQNRWSKKSNLLCNQTRHWLGQSYWPFFGLECCRQLTLYVIEWPLMSNSVIIKLCHTFCPCSMCTLTRQRKDQARNEWNDISGAPTPFLASRTL